MPRVFWLAPLLIFAFLGLARAQTDSPPAATAVIQQQLDAFQSDDFEAAFNLAAPSIQRQFGNAARFRLMIIHNYPMVWRSSSVQYLSAKEHAGQVFQRVMITDRANTVHLLLYQLVPLDNSWRIGGVQVLTTPKTDT
jgi:hypothetical protein